MSLMFLHLLSVVYGISEVVSVVYDIVYHILVFQQSSTRFVTHIELVAVQEDYPVFPCGDIYLEE